MNDGQGRQEPRFLGEELEQVEGCRWGERPQESCLVIFGASGDLAARKLIPALYRLHRTQGLPRNYVVLGVARTPMDDDGFRQRMRQALIDAGHELDLWEDFGGRLHYQPVQYDQLESYVLLRERLRKLEEAWGLPPRRLFYLAMPPATYAGISRMLKEAKLTRDKSSREAWRRLVVEKPFGWDLPSSQELNRALGEAFDEEQVFRIDHYLAKETVQNIMVLRFANAIFEPLWNRNYIDHVRINASESLGIGHRSGYYEEAGVIRDMFQNHLMMLLSLVAVEPPSRWEADRVRDEKTKLFRSLRPFPVDRLDEHLVLGQYAAGNVGGEDVVGYRDEEGVAPDSATPTYAALRLFVDNWRWQGVPFYVTSGKRLRRKVTRIDIQFKPVPHSLFRAILGENIQANRLVLGVQPEEVIFLMFQAKRPGARLCLRTSGLQFNYTRGGDGEPALDAYEKALGDALAGDQTLFWRQDALEQCWAFFDPILRACEQCPDRQKHLQFYPAGSFGPQKALDLLPAGSWPEKP